MDYPLTLDMNDYQEKYDQGKFETRYYLFSVIDILGSTNGHLNGKYTACTLREG